MGARQDRALSINMGLLTVSKTTHRCDASFRVLFADSEVLIAPVLFCAALLLSYMPMML
jgi:hypothetical protein